MIHLLTVMKILASVVMMFVIVVKAMKHALKIVLNYSVVMMFVIMMKHLKHVLMIVLNCLTV